MASVNVDRRLMHDDDGEAAAAKGESLLYAKPQFPDDDVVDITALTAWWDDNNDGDDVRCRWRGKRIAKREAMVMILILMKWRRWRMAMKIQMRPVVLF